MWPPTGRRGMSVDLGSLEPIVSEKIQTCQCDRQAIVYVRQSTVRQIEQNRESTRLPVRLGWKREQTWSSTTIWGSPRPRRSTGPASSGSSPRSAGPCRAHSRDRSLPVGALVPRLASAFGDVRSLRYPDRRCRRNLRSEHLQRSPAAGPLAGCGKTQLSYQISCLRIVDIRYTS
jgi:hypothetical protein